MIVLIVDDQPLVLRATCGLVNWKSLGVETVLTARSAEEAKKILLSQKVDVMLADIEMPREDGMSLQKWQAQNCPDVTTVFLTSHAEFSYAQEALRSGVFDYVLQPASIEDIEKVMRRCIEFRKGKAQHADAQREEAPSAPALPVPDGTKWEVWLMRGDDALVRNQIENLLRYAEHEQALTQSFLQNVLHSFLVALGFACQEKHINVESVYPVECPKARLEASFSSAQELSQCIRLVLAGYRQKLVTGTDPESESSNHDRIQDLLAYLGCHMNRMISRREAAKYVMLNEDYFSRVFRKETGMNYKEYITSQKMDYAKDLLSHTDIPVALISSKVGYDSFTNFSQMFRKYTGMTPTAYRKSASEPSSPKSENP